jgi:putative ABC transport system permease protein
LHRRRFVATVLAVILGVGFLTGTRMLNDTIDDNLGRLWRASSASTDVVVRGPALYTTNQGRTQYATLPDTEVAALRAVDGVAAAEPRKNASDIELLGPDGREAQGRGGGYIRSWPTDPRFALDKIVAGTAPDGLGQVVIDREFADRNGFSVGADAVVVTPTGRVTLRVVGLSDRADDNSQRGWGALGATVAQVQALAAQPGALDAVDVIAEPGVSPEDLVQRIESAGLGERASVATSEDVEAENGARFRTQLALFTQLLLLFSAVALFVTAFIIANTFGILVAQRTRELALFRAIGATRRQVLASVLTEAAAVGAVASLLGILAGAGLAWAALNGLGALGLRLPSVGLVVHWSRGVEAVVVGLAVTLLAALLPAIRATRVAPIAALRSAEVDTSGHSRFRIGAGVAATLVGVVLFAPAFGAAPSLDVMPQIGIGLAITLVALLVLGPIVVRPLVTVLAAPLPLLGGITGRLARQNASRSPRRTASTVAALTIGVALVGFITVLASSARASITQSISGGFRGDYLVQPDGRSGSFGADDTLRTQLAALPEVQAVTGITGTSGQLTLPDGATVATPIAGIDPATYGDLFDLPVVAGSLDDLGDDGLVVDRTVAADLGVGLGDRVEAVSVRSLRATYVIRALVAEDALLPDWATTTAGIARIHSQPSDLLVAVRTTGDASSARAALQTVVDRFPTMTLQDTGEYTADASGDIGTILNLLYALLAISIVIALIGITNTLSLSVHERTRELGLLRAVGMGRGQIRALIRWEAALVAVIGTVLGLAAGLGIAFTIVRALRGQGMSVFAVPVPAMAAIVVGGAVLGVLAAARPAARASKVDVVTAISET